MSDTDRPKADVSDPTVERPGAQAWVPESGSLDDLRRAAVDCRGCELWADATHVVFSVGRSAARIALVGEQPGDKEDLEGRPFIGPAGVLLASAVDAAGLARDSVYVTNSVKHFRFERRGTRRIHATPAPQHITACRPWLEAEMRVVEADVVVCLGATAGRAVLGRVVKIGAERGRELEASAGIAPSGARVMLTTHPSAVLRQRGTDTYDAAFDGLVADLTLAGRWIAEIDAERARADDPAVEDSAG